VLVYIVVFAVLLLGLWLAYRALGAPAAAIVEPEAALAAAWRALDAAVSAMATEKAPLPAAAQDGRRAAAAAAQHLSRLSPDGPAGHTRDLLASAAEDCGWAGRLMEAETYPGNPGLQAAAAALIDHSRRCLDEASVRGE
jgi:hypothetical protein